MKIIVCAKQVPDTNEVRIDAKRGTLIREGVPSILNPDDANALEAALQLKEQYPGSTVTIVSMGPTQATAMLRECLAMGADDAYLLSDRAFGGADTCATSATLAAAIEKIGGVDLILCGQQAIDGDTAQVGPQLAMRLGLPSVTYVNSMTLEAKTFTVKRALENGDDVFRISTPCLLTVLKELNQPRYMTVRGVFEAYEKPITVWNHESIGMDPNDCGLNASPTQVLRSFTPEPRGKVQMFCGDPGESARGVVEALRSKHMI